MGGGGGGSEAVYDTLGDSNQKRLGIPGLNKANIPGFNYTLLGE